MRKSRFTGVVDVIDAYEVPPTIVMKYIDCASLKDVVEAKQIRAFDALKIMKLTADIILQAHLLPETVLHRDIRPSNILLEEFDWSSHEYRNVRVIDFDLSWYKGAIGEDFVRTDRESMGFQAPEQLENVHSATRRTTLVDSYGIGATVYFCIAGKSPPINADREEGWDEMVFRSCAREFRVDSEIVQFLTRIIVQSMRSEPRDRISVHEIKTRIGDVIKWKRGKYTKCSTRFIVEMICASFTYGRYDVDEEHQIFRYSTPYGLTIASSYDYIKSYVVCKFEYEKPGNVNNSRADSVLNKLQSEFRGYFQGLAAVKNSFRFTGRRQFEAEISFNDSDAKENIRDIIDGVKRFGRALEIQ